MVCTGCVVEKAKPRTGLTIRPQANAQGSPAVPVEMPTGPIATPASTASRSSARILVQVDPLTTVNYDGQTLPLVSPDGRFIAVQEGEPPSWPTILAEPAARPPVGTHLVAYDVSAAPPQDRTTVLTYLNPLPRGLMLGRSCDNQGFLVEAPREDGSRWIGKVLWVTGQLQWLVQGDAVNAHAVLTPQGHLLYTTRGSNSDRSDLVMLAAGGLESRRTGEASYVFPVTTSERDVVYALALGAVGLEVEAIRVVEDPPGSRRFRLGLPLARELIGKPGDAALAFQVTASVQNAIVTGKEHEEVPSADPLVILNPRLERMAVFDTQASTFLPLIARSIAAVRWNESQTGGYLCTTPQGLMFTPSPVQGGSLPRSTNEVRLDFVPYVARTTASPESPVILFGPPNRNPAGKLDVRRMKVVSENRLKEAEGHVKEPPK